MTDCRSFLRDFRWSFRSAAVLCVVLCLATVLSRRAGAQAVPAAMWPAGGTGPTQQPLPGQLLGTNMTLNQGVNSLSAENESFDRFGLGLEASGGIQTNFLGTQTNQETAGYAEFSAQGATVLQTNRTRYFALYVPQYNLFPGNSEVNNFAQRFYQSLAHAFTEHTGVGWDLTAARYLSLNQFLPQVLGIGGSGVVVPTQGQQLLQDSFEITNVATNLRLQHLMSARMSFTGSLTSGYFQILPADVPAGSNRTHQRFFANGGDLQLAYQKTPRDTIGGELTLLYIYGLQPSGHNVAEIALATYQRQLTPTLSVRVGAGPLFYQVSSPLFGSIQETSYALNADLSRQVRQSQFALGYSRAFAVNILSPEIISNQVSFSMYLPLKSRWIAVGNARYIHNAGNNLYGSANIYGGTGQIAYQVASKIQLFVRYSLTSQNFNREPSLQPYDFTRNQIGGGIRFNMGNPVARGGMQ